MQIISKSAFANGQSEPCNNDDRIQFVYNGTLRVGKVVEVGLSKSGSAWFKLDQNGIVKTFTESKCEDLQLC